MVNRVLQGDSVYIVEHFYEREPVITFFNCAEYLYSLELIFMSVYTNDLTK